MADPATSSLSSVRGRATGENLTYQQVARKIVATLVEGEGWQPHMGEGADGSGVDVRIAAAGTVLTLDIALQSPDGGRLLVGECKRWKRALEQDHVFTLYGKMCALARELSKRAGKDQESKKIPVEGVLIAKGGFDPGLVKAAKDLGIRLARMSDTERVEAFVAGFPRYDEATKCVIEDVGVGVIERCPVGEVVHIALSSPRQS